MDGTRLKCYVSQDDGDPVCDWWGGLDVEVRGAFTQIRELLEAQPVKHWPARYFKELKDGSDGNGDGLGEIRIGPDPGEGKRKKEGYCHRIIGFEGPRDSEFTMVYAFDKNVDPKYETPCQKAQERKSDVGANWRLSRECQFPDD